MRSNSQSFWTNVSLGIAMGLLLFCHDKAISQTTFTESAAAYGLNLGGNKDDGHALADYDLNGDCDMVMNTNGNRRLIRNDG